MKEKVIFKKNKVDKILGFPRITELPINWYTLNNNPLDYFDEFDIEYFINNPNNGEKYDFSLSIFHDSRVEFQENPKSNYYYLIGPSISNSFFGKMKEEPFCFLDENILSDVKSKKCKIIILFGDDGHFGEKILKHPKDDELEIIQQAMIIKNLPKQSVHFVSQNLLVPELVKKYNYNFTADYIISPSLNYIDETSKKYEIDYSNFDKLFLCYNNTFSFSRLYLIYKLVTNHLLDFGYVSFHKSFDKNFFLTKIKTLNDVLEMKKESKIGVSLSNQIYNLAPLLLPKNNYFDDKPYDYFGQGLEISHYEKTFLSLVTESNCGSDTIYFSEKTYKPIIAKQPFIYLSSPNSLKKLKSFGFKTFDKWWDESYDSEVSYIERTKKIIKILKNLNTLSKSELLKIRSEMIFILNHNYNLYNKLQKERRFIDNLPKF